MRFSVTTSEWQRILKLVKAVAQASANARFAAHSACLFRVQPKDQRVKLEFSINGSFLDYEFSSLKILSLPDGADAEFRKALDLETLQSLRFSGKEIEIEIEDKDRSSTISFSSGSLKGKVYSSIPDIEEEIESTRPKEDSIELDYQFPIKDFKVALSAHLYGQHHDTNALKRPVRIYYKDGILHFVSRDQVAGATVVKALSLAPKSGFDIYLNPSHLLSVIDALAEADSSMFFFGFSDGYWRVYHQRANIWMPNLLRPATVDLDELFRTIDRSPSFKVTVSSPTLKSAISELNPFVNSASLATKEDLPVVCLVVNKEKQVYLRVETTKAKHVTQYLGQASFESTLPFDKEEEVYVNIKFLEEFNNHLSNNRASEGTDDVWIRWWTHQDPTMPTRGKGVCLGLGENRFLTSRTNFKRTSREL